jgi:tetratricopeptide (TPR) repeat protein
MIMFSQGLPPEFFTDMLHQGLTISYQARPEDREARLRAGGLVRASFVGLVMSVGLSHRATVEAGVGLLSFDTGTSCRPSASLRYATESIAENLDEAERVAPIISSLLFDQEGEVYLPLTENFCQFSVATSVIALRTGQLDFARRMLGVAIAKGRSGEERSGEGRLNRYTLAARSAQTRVLLAGLRAYPVEKRQDKEVIEALTRVVDDTRKVYGAWAPETLRETAYLAQYYEELGLLNTSLLLQGQNLEVLESLEGSPGSWEAVEAIIIFAETLIKNYDPAMAMQVISRVVMPSGPPPLPGELEALAFRRKIVMGCANFMQGEYGAAYDDFLEALGLLGESPRDSEALARTLTALGTTAMASCGKEGAVEAFCHFEREVEIRSRLTGPESIDTFAAMFRLATAAELAGSRDEALSLYQKIEEGGKNLVEFMSDFIQRVELAIFRLKKGKG